MPTDTTPIGDYRNKPTGVDIRTSINLDDKSFPCQNRNVVSEGSSSNLNCDACSKREPVVFQQ